MPSGAQVLSIGGIISAALMTAGHGPTAGAVMLLANVVSLLVESRRRHVR